MKKVFTTVAFLGLSGLTAPAFAQGGVYVELPPQPKISGGVEVVSQYVLRNAFVATPGPATQGNVSVSFDTGLYGEFSLNAWGSKGTSTTLGDELDLGGAWNKKLSDNLSVKFVYNRYFINDAPDIDELTVGVASGDFDASYTHYVWHDGMEDGDRLNIGYNHRFDDKWSGQVDLTGETGLGLSDAIIVGGDLNYAVTENVSVGATLLIPFMNEDDGRGAELIGSISYSF